MGDRALLAAVAVAVAMAMGIGVTPRAHAAVVVNVRAISATGAGQVSPDGKTATLHEGESVTVGVYIANLETLSGGQNGLGSVLYSVRSSGETIANGVSYPVSRTPTDTVLNASGSSLQLPPEFGERTEGSLVDIPFGPVNPDPFDTDLDCFRARAYQAPVPPAGAWLIGFGTGPVERLLGTVTFTACDLDETTRPYDRAVALNVYYLVAGGQNGCVLVHSLSTADPIVNSVRGLTIGAQNLGTAVIVTVTAIPLPAALWMGLGGLGMLAIGRRRGCRRVGGPQRATI